MRAAVRGMWLSALLLGECGSVVREWDVRERDRQRPASPPLCGWPVARRGRRTSSRAGPVRAQPGSADPERSRRRLSVFYLMWTTKRDARSAPLRGGGGGGDGAEGTATPPPDPSPQGGGDARQTVARGIPFKPTMLEPTACACGRPSSARRAWSTSSGASRRAGRGLCTTLAFSYAAEAYAPSGSPTGILERHGGRTS